MTGKTPLVLVPGLLNDANLWSAQIGGLGDIAAMQVADHTRFDSLDAIARSVLAAAPVRFALAGLSMGGYIALAILRLAPLRVTRLALLDTSARADTIRRLSSALSAAMSRRCAGKRPRPSFKRRCTPLMV